MRRPALLLALALAAGCSDAPVDTTAGTTAASTGATDEPATTGDDGTSDASSTGDATTVDPTDTTDAETTDGPGCQGPPPPCTNPVCEDSSWRCPCALAPEAGFAELEPIDFVLGEGDEATALRSSPARLFYSFHPASDDPCGKPLILLFNGGPGIGSELLLTSGTTATLLAESGALVENPSPWTALGNLLFVDARVAGLSYNLMDDPSDSAARAAEFSLANFNVYLDAADFARALLRFLAEHEPLARNQVMIVGESYGGTRATLLLHLLLFHAQYRDGARRYQDPALVDEIEAHLAGVFREEDTFPPDRVAAQFSHAALIQPLVAGEPQLLQSGALLEADGSPIWALAAELGETFIPCSELGPNCSPYLNVLGFVEQDAGRSRYDLDAPATWLTSYLNRTRVAFADHAALGALLGVPPESVALLAADARAQAYRLSGQFLYPKDDEPGDLPLYLGALNDGWDRYVVPFSREANLVFDSFEARALDVEFDDPHVGALFLENLVHVETLITAATRDVAIYSPAIPTALATHDQLVTDVVVDPDAPAVERPGQFEVIYVDAPLAGVDHPPPRVVRFPTYEGAGHAVTLDASAELLHDVEAWLGPPVGL